MTFEELHILYCNMTNIYKFGNGDFSCQEMEGYHNAIRRFLKAGRLYYEAQNLTTEQLYFLFERDLKLRDEIMNLDKDEEVLGQRK